MSSKDKDDEAHLDAVATRIDIALSRTTDTTPESADENMRIIARDSLDKKDPVAIVLPFVVSQCQLNKCNPVPWACVLWNVTEGYVPWSCRMDKESEVAKIILQAAEYPTAEFLRNPVFTVIARCANPACGTPESVRCISDKRHRYNVCKMCCTPYCSTECARSYYRDHVKFCKSPAAVISWCRKWHHTTQNADMPPSEALVRFVAWMGMEKLTMLANWIHVNPNTIFTIAAATFIAVTVKRGSLGQ